MDRGDGRDANGNMIWARAPRGMTLVAEVHTPNPGRRKDRRWWYRVWHDSRSGVSVFRCECGFALDERDRDLDVTCVHLRGLMLTATEDETVAYGPGNSGVPQVHPNAHTLRRGVTWVLVRLTADGKRIFHPRWVAEALKNS